MYTQADMRRANALVRRRSLILGIGLFLLLAAYIAAILAGSQGLMLAIALAAFWFASLEICIWLRPAAKYRAFLREAEKGLRRECVCTVESLDTKIQLQDGVRVYAIQVRLADGDTRIFYLNASKTENFPAVGKTLRLTGYGRHIMAWEEIQC